MTNDEQMELSLECGRGCPPAVRRGRPGRAHWWFERMRQVVDRARDWQPAPPERPEQIWFAASAAVSRRGTEERQICE
jgi:hypothetical protein